QWSRRMSRIECSVGPRGGARPIRAGVDCYLFCVSAAGLRREDNCAVCVSAFVDLAIDVRKVSICRHYEQNSDASLLNHHKSSTIGHNLTSKREVLKPLSNVAVMRTRFIMVRAEAI